MEIIISHQRTDFDGLASMVAAQKLHPKGVMVFSGKLTKNVKKFMALYRDRITVKYARDINKDDITRVIMVDTRVPSRLGVFSDLAKKDGVDFLIYDHHLDRKGLIPQAKEVIEEVGATITMLVNRLKAKKIEITPFEATLFALGIYEDTGCLIYKSTTSTDAKSVAYLLEKGANLEIVEDYIEYSLNRKQQELFNKLLDSLYQVSVKGFAIDIFSVEIDEYIPDIALLAHKLNELHNAEALFILIKQGDKVLIIGRSNNDSIDVGDILNYYGGGGHSRAASANIKGDTRSLIDWQEELLCTIKGKVNPAILVKDIMSTPVKTVGLDTTMGEADKIMQRYGYSGLVVVDDEETVGIISRRDIDKVRKHNLLHAPVKGYMSTKPVTIDQEASLKEVQEEIVNHDIGRLPVVDKGGKLVGIISRSDLLKTFYGREDYLMNKQNLYGRSLVEVQEKRYNIIDKFKVIDDDIMKILRRSGELAQEMGFNLYIVGGFVRDLLLDKVNLDLDLVVEGDGIEFSRKLAQELKGELDIYHEFGTALISLDKIKLDIATTRVEYYSNTASLPEVEKGSIQEDLFRRDFSINALAIQLNAPYFGQLVDYFNGKADLEKGIIRLLHNFSLYDDPTRIFRGLRFASRYRYKFEERTEELIRQGIELDIVDKMSCERLFSEVKLGLEDDDPIKFIGLLNKYGLLSYIDENLSWDDQKVELASKISKILDWLSALEVSFSFEEWVLYLMILFKGLEKEKIRGLKEKLSLNKNLFYRLLATIRIDDDIKMLKQAHSSSQIYYFLQSLAIEDIILILLLEPKLEAKVSLYLEELQWVDLEVSGEDIIEYGYKPGPFFQDVLKEVKRAKLDGEVNGYKEELEYLREYIEKRGD
ncbi:CBS domain-containing protein [Halonatronum saccharophilum]|uniref:CBS domain-containing protein n=1 Tax=Halonatronum saccharophilum TaxID=150060 RepID=UPI000482A0E4|nr:CBS domain-containing protein [Halonatronum saccharophilum]